LKVKPKPPKSFPFFYLESVLLPLFAVFALVVDLFDYCNYLFNLEI
jgi:hypothetical protein